MLAFNVLTVEEAYASINYDTIILLFGMMIVVANLRLSGFFTIVSAWVVEHARRPFLLLGGIVIVSGVFPPFPACWWEDASSSPVFFPASLSTIRCPWCCLRWCSRLPIGCGATASPT